MAEKFQVGQIIEGTVTGVKQFGAFVALDESTQGLVHISHITHEFLANIADAVKVGDKVKVKILSIDGEKGKISLSMKNALPPPQKPQQSKPKPKQKKEVPIEDFENLMKNFLKDSTDRQTDINKRLNNR
ncbi:RNA-binding protein S1 [Candidatus Epulonipiscium fishelsonii]|uniref:RNA-binding protein S1 n=1 Tax=Candidatus Epulonipiscium fishelsonii TaxID=77094 RepID=A0ACC8XGK6_9FIRM|nr:RNA-binding protein S1 [Epulopiscium sp. SCG-B05WGA-EpuloA1]ONI42650.1 RNA-binding protein S1 [Epulopiscium sp. SCG-B11WGA-EpuloA1]